MSPLLRLERKLAALGHIKFEVTNRGVHDEIVLVRRKKEKQMDKKISIEEALPTRFKKDDVLEGPLTTQVRARDWFLLQLESTLREPTDLHVAFTREHCENGHITVGDHDTVVGSFRLRDSGAGSPRAYPKTVGRAVASHVDLVIQRGQTDDPDAPGDIRYALTKAEEKRIVHYVQRHLIRTGQWAWPATGTDRILRFFKVRENE